MRSDDTVSQFQRAVAAEVRAEMARRKVSQTDVAQWLGVAQATVSRRVTGEVAFDVAELEKIAALLGVAVQQFIPNHVAAA